jgi:hypothetical protein
VPLVTVVVRTVMGCVVVSAVAVRNVPGVRSIRRFDFPSIRRGQVAAESETGRGVTGREGTNRLEALASIATMRSRWSDQEPPGDSTLVT